MRLFAFYLGTVLIGLSAMGIGGAVVFQGAAANADAYLGTVISMLLALIVIANLGALLPNWGVRGLDD